ncbi:N-acetylglucosamine-6-phosphate deacetylase [Erysipelothrix urinaevulpis]|uniref:N-acetylglucosamine-6-phosphate deacetylase n=1 Tax=Erysipelothrix urinaevulpis TaxID=2683717 RepID=UPI0013573422|nr:N-acetylglucosamine-6-phosphate deacetylase [Erysipelothrix urinaevulpis]
MLIINGKLYLEDRVIDNGYIKIENDKIISLGKMEFAPKDDTIIDAEGMNVLPGFIDQHIHGANGADHMDATQKALKDIASFLPKEGTTSYLATTMTQSVENVDKALEEIVKYVETDNKPGEAEILGIHLEGPFISKKHVGAQNPDYVQKPTIDSFNHFWKTAKGKIKLITYAPEEAEKGFTNRLRELGVIPSAGHTDSTFDQIVAEIPEGLSNLTHFHNAMTPHHHREPGVVTAGFMYPELKAELIVDGIHLHPHIVDASYKIKGVDNVIAITDAMRAKGLPDGEYDLGGQTVYKKGKECRIESGSLAGSVAEMDFVVRNLRDFTGCSMEDLVKMSSANSAKHLEVFDRKGSLTAGKDADIVIVDNDINVQATICRGVLSFQK